MILTGYHGTDLTSAESIIKSRQYYLSTNDDNWLGDGIYFYFNFEDALNWRKGKTVLHSLIKVNTDEYLDMDSDEGRALCYDIQCFLYKEHGKTVAPIGATSDDMRQKNECAVMRMIWKTNPQINVLSAAFPTEKTKFPIMLDSRPKRREFCVRNNEPIIHTYMIKEGDINEQH